jgi:hypothetical protein
MQISTSVGIAQDICRLLRLDIATNIGEAHSRRKIGDFGRHPVDRNYCSATKFTDASQPFDRLVPKES